jgi:hypothetical protein
MDGKKLKKIIERYWFLLLAALVLFLRIPLIFEPFTYGDEGIYLTLGQAARRGLVFYQEIHDNKPPLLYLIAALTGSYPAYRTFFFGWSLVTIWLFYQLSQQLFGKNKSAVVLTTFLFALFYSLRLFEGTVGNAENFLVATSLAGFWVALKAKKTLHYLFAGFLFSLSVLFKVPALFDFATLLAFLFWQDYKKPLRPLISKYLGLLAGFISPILLTLIYYAYHRALKAYLKAAFLQNLPYLSSWGEDQPQAGGLPFTLFIRALIVVLLFLFLLAKRKKITPRLSLILLWFSLALFAALLSSRPYPHYLLQAIPPLALSFGFLTENRFKRLIPLFLTGTLMGIFYLFHFWHYSSYDYLSNFYQYALGGKNQAQYYQYFGEQTPFLYQSAKFLSLHTAKEEKIFVWGTQPSIYALARRLPVGRYAASYHIIDFAGQQETIKALKQSPPRFMVVDEKEKSPFPAFFGLLEGNYSLFSQIGNFLVYRRQI